MKRNQPTGSTEITIRNADGEVTIRRELVSGQKGGVFFMNGVKKTNKDIDKFVKSQNIVLENFCNFLLQEKVKPFAECCAETPRLLREVEVAVGPPGMVDEHENLVKLAESKRDSEREHRIQKEQLAHLEAQEANMRDELERHAQLREIDERVKLLELKVPMLKVRPKYREVHENERGVQTRPDATSIWATLVPMIFCQDRHVHFLCKLR